MVKAALAQAAEERQKDHAQRTAAWAAAVAAGRGAGYYRKSQEQLV